MVLILRHNVARQELIKMDGTQLLTYAYKNGLLDAAALADARIGNIEITGATAKAEYIKNKKATGVFIGFNKEPDGWKLDITSLFKISSYALNQLIANSGLSENDFIIKVAERTKGTRADETIWEPLASE